MRIFKYFLALIGALIAGLIVAGGIAGAQAVTRAYNTDTPLQRGMIVRVTEKDSKKVEALKAEDIEKMEGVVVAANDAPVTLSSEDRSTQQVFIATTGRYSVLVSNQNGTIRKDDYITISSVAGIGMKAGGSHPRIAGKALNGFDGKTDVSGRMKVKTADNKEVEIALGMVAVDISIGQNPILERKNDIIPGVEFLQRAAGEIVDKPVAPTQLYISLLALIVTSIISGSILYAGVRTSMVAIGRNPLAKSSVMKNLVQVVVTSVIILIIGLTTVYLILKL